jgi:phosphatidylinositol-3-phosphatase
MDVPRTIGVRLAALCCVCFVALEACSSTSTAAAPSSAVAPSTAGGSPTASPSGGHSANQAALKSDPPLVVIFMENHEQGDVVGSSSAPYQNSLIRQGRSYTNYFAISHPSLPNYLAFASGSTHGKTDDTVSAGEFGGPTLWTQLTAAGIPWAVYEESMPSPCFTQAAAGSAPGDYALKHDPAMPFSAVASSNAACNRVQPLTDMNPNKLPPMSFITPNECSDAHSCDLSAGDTWLRDHVPDLVKAGANVIVTYDEGTSDLGVGGAGGGHVFALEVGPGVPSGVRVTKTMNHYSLLAGIEQRFHLARLGGASGVAPLPI